MFAAGARLFATAPPSVKKAVVVGTTTAVVKSSSTGSKPPVDTSSKYQAPPNPVSKSQDLVTQSFGQPPTTPPKNLGSRFLHGFFSVSKVPSIGTPELFSSMPKALSSLVLLDGPERKGMLKMQALGLFNSSSPEYSQVAVRTDDDGSHRYAHVGKKTEVTPESIEMLKCIAQQKNGSEEAVALLLQHFPSLTSPSITGKTESGDMDVRLTPGAHIRAKMDILDLGGGKLSLSLLAHTQLMHPLRGVASWNLIVDTERQVASFCVTGTGKHNSERMDKANNQLIECGFWGSMEDSLMSQLSGKKAELGNHSMFSLLQSPNMLVGPLMSMTTPVDPTQVPRTPRW